MSSPIAPSMLEPSARRSNAQARAVPSTRNPLSFKTAAAWALLVALLMSTQYLVQPFVWINWPVEDVLKGWLEVAWDRIVVAVPIALTLVIATRVTNDALIVRALAVAAAIVVGAATGEAALLIIGSSGVRTGTTAIVGSVMQWSGVALCAFGTYFLWSRHLQTEAMARALDLARSANEAMLIETRLRSLRQQIEPHFLFNTLATIRRLREIDSSEGATLLRHLVNYVDSSARSAERLTTVGDEADLVASYLGIVAIRLGGRLSVRVDVPLELRSWTCPPLVMATLVENAVKHGVTPCSDATTIAVVVRKQSGSLVLCVEDTGVGISSAAETFGGTGIGLANIRAQISALYAHQAALTIERNEPRGVRAIVRLPLVASNASTSRRTVTLP